MKRSILTIILLIAAITIFAHPPISFKIIYNETMLSIGIRHEVDNASKHHIDKLSIEHEGEILIMQKFNGQTSKEMQEAIYKIDGLEEGDKIKITAHCNIAGKKSTEYIIPAEEAEADEE